MTPERLAAIRDLANKDYSAAHEDVLEDTFAGTARLVDALREAVGEIDCCGKIIDHLQKVVEANKSKLAEINEISKRILSTLNEMRAGGEPNP